MLATYLVGLRKNIPRIDLFLKMLQKMTSFILKQTLIQCSEHIPKKPENKYIPYLSLITSLF